MHYSPSLRNPLEISGMAVCCWLGMWKRHAQRSSEHAVVNSKDERISKWENSISVSTIMKRIWCEDITDSTPVMQY